MARLTVRLHGQELTNLKLESGFEYIAGRAQDAQIRMENQRGISRQHLKFYERDGQWVCESLSKFVMIQKGHDQVLVLELNEVCVFTVSSYEFHFDPEIVAENAAAESEAKPIDNLPAFLQPQSASEPQEGLGDGQENTSLRANNDATIAGGSTLMPYLRISHPNTADDEVLKLEGQIWVAGRDQGCEITIDSPHISRRHFELVRTKEGFFITDLGSANGTKLNGQRLPPHEPTRIESGDEIRVMTIEMSFEIRDAQFNHRVDNLPVATFDPMLVLPPQNPYWQAYPPELMPPQPQFRDGNGIPDDWTQLRPHHLKQVDWKKNKVRVAILVLALVFVVMAITEPDGKNEGNRDPAQKDNASPSFDKLTKEQQSVVKDTFKLATSLYVNGKYALCLTELAKLHELIPQFDNSKELQSYCEQGLELVRNQEDQQRRERERQQIERQISNFVENCKTTLTVESTVEDTRFCLAEAMELSPEHPLVVEMLHTAQLREQERKFIAEQKRKEQALAVEGEKHFQRALAIYKDGRLAASLAEFERFLETDYPRDESMKADAKRQLATIKKELQTKVDFHLDQCRALGDKGRFKEAWESCDKALQEQPKNKEARALRDSMLSKLRREMKSIYEDSVLEESLGNVDSAKEKWKKIITENLPFDEYSKKAKSKLQKYEGL